MSSNAVSVLHARRGAKFLLMYDGLRSQSKNMTLSRQKSGNENDP